MLNLILVSWPGFAAVLLCYMVFWFLGQDSLRFFKFRCYSGFLVRVPRDSFILNVILVSGPGFAEVLLC
jgi:hypothetical protein